MLEGWLPLVTQDKITAEVVLHAAILQINIYIVLLNIMPKSFHKKSFIQSSWVVFMLILTLTSHKSCPIMTIQKTTFNFPPLYLIYIVY